MPQADLKNCQNIVILTGAGISAESGIRTFRAKDGLWENHDLNDVATPEGFKRNPQLVNDFYNQRRAQLQQPYIQPNPAHLALAKLADEFNGEVTLVTQNIDDLHERAGAYQVIHMHGELLKVRCPNTNQTLEWKGDLSVDDMCTCCQFPEPMRPHVVWFGEMPLYLDRIYSQLSQTDLFISIGTSGSVYPAAGFVHEAASQGAHTIEINLEPSEISTQFKELRQGTAGVLVPQLVEEILTAVRIT
ncbi:NAD-dependent protein deacylase [Motilimonas cestriensis]|uniref:NAD-dependent protein deacylase n=1 Tax=Motilimonas cestriensis TaxID=2742685 RepID=A0ABS8WCW6_9GAMM|nr:Sir2 family NAD+-dependent deacetylase [Motilimonas cestriensis]MCE2595190.1 NAD-dependent protein deacylase [Motilimonas cestriensis]